MSFAELKSETGNQKLFLKRPGRNVLAVVGAFKTDLRRSRIHAIHRSLQIRRPRRYPQHSSAGCEKRSVAPGGTGMKDLHAFHFARVFESHNLFAYFVGARISAGRNDHTHRGVRRPAKISFADPAVNRSLKRFQQIALETRQDGLRFRFAESAM